jgi:hypothetical protein
MASVNVTPTPRQAQLALAEAAGQAAAIRRTDRQLGIILLGLAAAFVAVGVVVGLSPVKGGSTSALAAFLVLMLCAAVGFVALFWRIRAYSRTGIRRFTIACAAFTFWNALVAGVSSATHWWAADQPAGHFTVSAVVGAIPLVVAAWLLVRNRG